MTGELVLVGMVFLLAGGVKGVIGLGLPTVSLGLLTAIVGLESAMVLMLVPSFVTNLWQAFSGGHFLAVVKRIWLFLLFATVCVWGGGLLASNWHGDTFASLLGGLLIAYAIVGLAGPPIAIRRPLERWVGPVAGAVNGVLTGLTGSFVVPGVPYLQALGLRRDQLIQAMGILFTASTLALGLTLGGFGRIAIETGVISAAAVLPALAGMIAGSRIRRRLDEATFRRVFLWALILLGAYILLRSF